jgi:hypothetical protein
LRRNIGRWIDRLLGRDEEDERPLKRRPPEVAARAIPAPASNGVLPIGAASRRRPTKLPEEAAPPVDGLSNDEAGDCALAVPNEAAVPKAVLVDEDWFGAPSPVVKVAGDEAHSHPEEAAAPNDQDDGQQCRRVASVSPTVAPDEDEQAHHPDDDWFGIPAEPDQAPSAPPPEASGNATGWEGYEFQEPPKSANQAVAEAPQDFDLSPIAAPDPLLFDGWEPDAVPPPAATSAQVPGRDDVDDWFTYSDFPEPSVADGPSSPPAGTPAGSASEPVFQPLDKLAWRVGGRAAELVNEMELYTVGTRAAGMAAIAALLREFPHSSSHAAITRLVRHRASIGELEACAELIRYWRANDHLWRRWRFDRLRTTWMIDSDLRHGAASLTWRVAHDLLGERDVEELLLDLEGAWLEAWLAQDRDRSGFDYYLDYARCRAAIASHAAGAGWIRAEAQRRRATGEASWR